MKKLLWLILFFKVINLHAQYKYKSEPFWGFSVISDKAQGQFSKAGYNDSWGFSTEYFSKDILHQRIPKVGLRLGGSFMGAGHGSFHTGVLMHQPYLAHGSQRLSNNRTELDF